jgi:general secretion pathway protein G
MARSTENGKRSGRPLTARLRWRLKGRVSGFSFLELIVVLTILGILVGLAMPVTRNEGKRRKERELKYVLKQMRDGIDRYKLDCERGLVSPLDRRVGDNCFPPTLDRLVEGINPPNSERTIRYLRSVPVDPITGNTEWGLRSDEDEPDAFAWGGQNVYDVYTKSEQTALNGSRYKDW